MFHLLEWPINCHLFKKCLCISDMRLRSEEIKSNNITGRHCWGRPRCHAAMPRVSVSTMTRESSASQRSLMLALTSLARWWVSIRRHHIGLFTCNRWRPWQTGWGLPGTLWSTQEPGYPRPQGSRTSGGLKGSGHSRRKARSPTWMSAGTTPNPPRLTWLLQSWWRLER